MWRSRDTAVVQRRKPSWDIIALLLKKGNQSFEVVSDYFYPTSLQGSVFMTALPYRSIPIFCHSCAIIHEGSFLERNTCFFVFAFQHGLKLSYHKETLGTLKCEGNRAREPELSALGARICQEPYVFLALLFGCLLPTPILKWSQLTRLPRELGVLCWRVWVDGKAPRLCLLICRPLHCASNTAMLVLVTPLIVTVSPSSKASW